MSLKRPVTLAQARRWPAAAARRESFCARMGGMREQLTSERTARDPRSRINRALAAWDCDEPELLQRKHVSKGIRPMKITSKMVGAEAKKVRARKNPDQTRKVGIFNVRYVPAGGTLGPRNASGKTNGIAKAPQVEFYDSRYPHTPRGQFVTAYYAETLNDAPLRTGLLLDTGSPAWRLDRDELLEVKRMIARSGDFGPVLNPARKRATKAAKPRANPASAKLYTVHTVTGDGKPRDPIAHFRKRADALTYAKAYAKAYGAPVVLTGRAL